MDGDQNRKYGNQNLKYGEQNLKSSPGITKYKVFIPSVNLIEWLV